MKLSLGTVQFGTRYGIQNAGQPSVEDSVSMLEYAVYNGVEYLDTATAYGTAELVVGELFRRRIIKRDNVKICSKITLDLLPNCTAAEYRHVLRDKVKKSLERLGTDYLDACLFHQAALAYNPVAQEALAELQDEGILRHSGVSVYTPEEAKACIESQWVDMIQIPVSIFDQRMMKAGVFDKSQERPGFEIHSRSAFVQGLIMMHEDDIPEAIAQGGAREAVRRFRMLCEAHGMSKMELAIQYVKQIRHISHLVFGVDNLSQLKEYIRVFREEKDPGEVMEIANEFRNLDPMIYMPASWNKIVQV